jgi:hypothetical protein
MKAISVLVPASNPDDSCAGSSLPSASTHDQPAKLCLIVTLMVCEPHRIVCATDDRRGLGDADKVVRCVEDR